MTVVGLMRDKRERGRALSRDRSIASRESEKERAIEIKKKCKRDRERIKEIIERAGEGKSEGDISNGTESSRVTNRKRKEATDREIEREREK